MFCNVYWCRIRYLGPALNFTVHNYQFDVRNVEFVYVYFQTIYCML